MDDSPRNDTPKAIQEWGNILNGSNYELSDKFNRFPGRSSGTRPLSLDAASDAHLKENRNTSDKPPELSFQRYQTSQNNDWVNHGGDLKEAVGPGARVRSKASHHETSNVVRPSTKIPDVRTLDFDAGGRRRSRSIGPGQRGSRIAAVGLYTPIYPLNN